MSVAVMKICHGMSWRRLIRGTYLGLFGESAYDYGSMGWLWAEGADKGRKERGML